MNAGKLIWTKRFSKDVKRAKRRNQNLDFLQKVIKMLHSGDTLPQKYKLHLRMSLTGFSFPNLCGVLGLFPSALFLP